VLWAKAIGTSRNPQTPWAVASDAAGNCFVTSDLLGVWDLGDGVMVTNSSWDGTVHTLLAKVDGTGKTLWAREAASGAWNTPRAIAADAEGNCYVTGEFNGYSIVFGQSVVVGLQTNEVFTAKFDSMGKPLWANRFGNGQYEEARGIAVDGAGNCYMIGTWYYTQLVATNLVFPNGLSSRMLYPYPKYNHFIMKYAPDGAALWTKYLTNRSPEILANIVTDSSGNAHLAGAWWKDNSNVVTFDALTITNMNPSRSEVFVAELGTNTPLSELSRKQRHTSPVDPFKLQAIFLGPKPSALVGGQSVGVGDKVGRYMVASIAAETVTLKSVSGKSKVLAMGDERVGR
jgi:hypothetical protein